MKNNKHQACDLTDHKHSKDNLAVSDKLCNVFKNKKHMPRPFMIYPTVLLIVATLFVCEESRYTVTVCL